MRAMVLAWNLPPESVGRLRYLCMSLRIDLLLSREGGRPLGELLRQPDAPLLQPVSFDEPMLLMAGLSISQFHALVDGLKAQRLPRVPLKAVLTPTNRTWNAETLHRELAKERQALERGK